VPAAPSAPMSAADAARLQRIYEFLSAGGGPHPQLPGVGAAPFMLTYVIPGQPETKVRHRTGPDGVAYTDPQASAAERATAQHLRAMVAGRGPLPGNLALGCVFFRSHRGHIDSDNLVKHVCDAGNGVAWIDDVQITAQLGVIEYDPVHPRTLIVVGPHHSSMDRSSIVSVRPPPTNRGKRAKKRSRGYGYHQCAGCDKTVSAALTHCGDCRRGLTPRVANLDRLF